MKKKFFLIMLYFSNIIFANSNMLDQIFEKAKDEDTVVNTSFSSQSDLTLSLRNIIILLSKIALALGVTLFLRWGIRFLLSVGDESKMKKARDDLILVWLGLILTLWSLWVLYLLQTIPKWIS